MKGTDKKISMITAYDYTMAKIVDESGVNTILVGDSLGNTILGYEDTISVTVDDMIHHSAAVARGAKNALVITDMPFMSYQTSVYDAVVNAGRIMKEGRAGAVKLEGGQDMCPQISAIVKASIPVCAHLGLTPQSINAFGGFKVQGKTEAAAKKLIEDAKEKALALQKKYAHGKQIDNGVRTGEACEDSHRDSKHPYHRNRRRSLLRWTGACKSGYVWHVFRLCSKVRKAVCKCGRCYERCG